MQNHRQVKELINYLVITSSTARLMNESLNILQWQFDSLKQQASLKTNCQFLLRWQQAMFTALRTLHCYTAQRGQLRKEYWTKLFVYTVSNFFEQNCKLCLSNSLDIRVL